MHQLRLTLTADQPLGCGHAALRESGQTPASVRGSITAVGSHKRSEARIPCLKQEVSSTCKAGGMPDIADLPFDKRLSWLHHVCTQGGENL